MYLSRHTQQYMTIVGTCPHCGAKVTFQQCAGIFHDGQPQGKQQAVAAMQCIACEGFILAIAKEQVVGQEWRWVYQEHYPLGKPKDDVPEEIPDHIREDFREALRCQWVRAFNATAEMCRRTVESSCINLGAPYSKVLQEMINWLETQKIITPPLRDVAHKVRLGGDRAAHPGEDPLSEQPKYEAPIQIEEPHAAAIVEFTRHFLEHVYVIPKRLPTFDFSRPKKI
jgi:hypothetical protein